MKMPDQALQQMLDRYGQPLGRTRAADLVPAPAAPGLGALRVEPSMPGGVLRPGGRARGRKLESVLAGGRSGRPGCVDLKRNLVKEWRLASSERLCEVRGASMNPEN